MPKVDYEKLKKSVENKNKILKSDKIIYKDAKINTTELHKKE